MLRFYTAGESHGQALLAFISGLPASLPVDVEFINHELRRRQLGYGRGGRQKIEKDTAEIFAGVRHGKTIGAPIALRIENRDWANWEKILPVEASGERIPRDERLVHRGRGMRTWPARRNLIFTMRAIFWSGPRRAKPRPAWPPGAFAKLLLREFGTEIASHTMQVGHVRIEKAGDLGEIHAVSEDLDSPLRCVDAAVQEKMKAEVDAALQSRATRSAGSSKLSHTTFP